MNKYGTLPGSFSTYPVPILKNPNPNGRWEFPLTEIHVSEPVKGKVIGKYHLHEAFKGMISASVGKYLEEYEFVLNDPAQRTFVIQKVYQAKESIPMELLAPVPFSVYFENVPNVDFDQLPESTPEEREVKLKAAESILMLAILSKLSFPSGAFIPIARMDGGNLISMEYVLFDLNLAGMSRTVSYVI